MANRRWLLGLIVISIFLGGNSVFAQTIKLKGQVQDSVGNPVPNTNLIATPKKENAETTFAIADQKGQYQLKLSAEVPYKIEITSLGFSPLSDSLTLTEDREKDYILRKSTESLEQVVVKAKMAMVVKEDTITYKTDKFKTGDERKLREILKKLPGVEVDRDGNVKVNGKKVTKLMVDGQDFFGGDTKLGVNNIPADAVDQVQAIDDYHEVGFMKGLSDSDKMAMNIKLKKDKKHFVFGESEAGGGIKKRYLIHPTLFYYSPETTVNFIGSLNNVNESPLDWEDVMRFRGGYASFLDNPINSGNAGLTQFSHHEDIRRKNIQFGAANLTQKIGSDLRLEAYSIVAGQKSRAESHSLKEYLTRENLIENKDNTDENKGFSTFNKIKLRYQPEPKTDIAYNLIANISNRSHHRQLKSQFTDSTNHINTLKDPHDLEISQYFRYNRQPSYEHTSEIRANYTFKKSSALSNWGFDRPVFSDLIPFKEDSDGYNFFNDYRSTTQTGQFKFKHYWVLNNTNHIYPKAGLYYFHQDYNSRDYQQLTDGKIHSFSSAGFDNDISYQLFDPYIGFQYKIKLGEVIFRPGLVYHHYFWRVNQFSKRLTDENKGVWSPEFKIEYKPSIAKKLEFNYHLKSSFADAEQYADRFRLTDYNQLYRGNAHLENSLYHDLSLLYRSHNLASGITYSLRLLYKHRKKSIRQTTRLEGIDQISTSLYSDYPENTYNFSGLFSKRWSHYSVNLNGRIGFSDYARLINDEKIAYKAQNYTYKLYGRTIFKDWPNLEIGLQQDFRISKSDQYRNNFWTARPYAELDYAFLNGFILKADYEYNYDKDQTSAQSTQYQMGNASLYYKAEDSPWGFEVRVNNLFDLRYKRDHHFDQFIVYDQRIYLQPRTVLLILSYQL